MCRKDSRRRDPNGRRQPAGFTVLELVITISVLALLLAIAIPAVMSARESSRRMECANHLRQFGQALHAFEAAHGHFPPATVETEKRGDPPHSTSVHHYAPHVHLLPYLDQQTVFQQIRLDQPLIEVWNPVYLDAPANITIPVFLCPSDRERAGTNYRVCTGVGPNAFDDPRGTLPPEGAFSNMTGQPAREFHDGLSQTAAASERIQSDDDPTTFAPREDFWFSNAPAALGHWPTADEMQSVCASLTAPPDAFYPHVGQSWLVAGYDYTWYNHILAPNSTVADCTVNGRAHNPVDPTETMTYSASLAGAHKASSLHSGGVNLLLMDGAVRFVNDSIDINVWRGLATRRRGEIVQLAGY